MWLYIHVVKLKLFWTTMKIIRILSLFVVHLRVLL